VRLSLSVTDNLAGGFVAPSSIDSDAALEAKAELLTCVYYVYYIVHDDQSDPRDRAGKVGKCESITCR
jgi:hypothetical protein